MVFKSEPHPWLQPLSRRLGVIFFIAFWIGFEHWNEPGSIWFWMAIAVLAWALWDFFFSGNYRPKIGE